MARVSRTEAARGYLSKRPGDVVITEMAVPPLASQFVKRITAAEVAERYNRFGANRLFTPSPVKFRLCRAPPHRQGQRTESDNGRLTRCYANPGETLLCFVEYTVSP